MRETLATVGFARSSYWNGTICLRSTSAISSSPSADKMCLVSTMR